MVKVTVAGGSGQVSGEIIDALLATKIHEITVFSRKEAPAAVIIPPGVQWQVVDYNDKARLVEALKGTHTLLSLVQVLSDTDQQSQRNLIDAAVMAGVKRFAPSEYGSKGTDHMSWCEGKRKVREYLESLNEKETVLEYTLFQPGLFLDYLAYPYKTSKHLDPLQTLFDFRNKRAMMADGGEDAIITFTSVADVAAIVARAVGYEGKWPTTGGIRGNRVTFAQIIDIGKRIRGSFTVEKTRVEDLEVGKLNTSWAWTEVHQAVPDDQASALLKQVPIGMLLSSSKGGWDVSDEWNQILPDYEFTPIENFLADVWEGKP